MSWLYINFAYDAGLAFWMLVFLCPTAREPPLWFSAGRSSVSQIFSCLVGAGKAQYQARNVPLFSWLRFSYGDLA